MKIDWLTLISAFDQTDLIDMKDSIINIILFNNTRVIKSKSYECITRV